MRTIARLGTALSLGLAAPALAQDDPAKVGFIYVGPVGDFGWTYEHDQARQELEAEFGDQIETVYQESVPEGADAERALTQMALSGADLIFTTSFGFMEATMAVAEQFPDVMFEHATGYQRAENVATYGARFYEGRAVIGHIAGHMTETNKVGYIASYPIPEVIRGINSAYLHAKEVNPDIEFDIVWVNSWFDPAREADAAQALIDQGADILMQHTDSTAPMNLAEDAGIYAFGQASDMSNFGPDAQLTAIVDNWTPYYVERVRAVMDGSWESEDTWGGFDADMVKMAPFSDDIPDDVMEEVEQLISDIESGAYHPFTGPINRADGSEWLAEGETATDEELLGMDFYVEGIDAQLPD